MDRRRAATRHAATPPPSVHSASPHHNAVSERRACCAQKARRRTRRIRIACRSARARDQFFVAKVDENAQTSGSSGRRTDTSGRVASRRGRVASCVRPLRSRSAVRGARNVMIRGEIVFSSRGIASASYGAASYTMPDVIGPIDAVRRSARVSQRSRRFVRASPSCMQPLRRARALLDEVERHQAKVTESAAKDRAPPDEGAHGPPCNCNASIICPIRAYPRRQNVVFRGFSEMTHENVESWGSSDGASGASEGFVWGPRRTRGMSQRAGWRGGRRGARKVRF